MKKYVFAMLLVSSILMAGGHVYASDMRMLPELRLFQPNGTPLPVTASEQTDNWALIVVDANLPSGRSYLDALLSKRDTFSERLWVVVLGTAEDLREYMNLYSKLSGVRWLHSDVNLVQTLELPGTPAVLGVNLDKSIAWQLSGLPSAPEQLPARIKGWLGMGLNIQTVEAPK